MEDLKELSEAFAANPDAELVVRDADLFAAGHYPDRKLTVSEADIRRLAEGPLPVPLKVEHGGKLFVLGSVLGLQADGKWLRGKVGLFPEASKLLDRLGIKGLSVGVTRLRDGLGAIREVSVTESPRVAGAALFSGSADLVRFSEGEQGEDQMDNEKVEQLSNRLSEMEAKLAAEAEARAAAEAKAAESGQIVKEFSEKLIAMESDIAREKAEATAEKFCTAGVLPPVARKAATALLMQNRQTVNFSNAEGEDVQMSVAETFTQVLENLPSIIGKGLKGTATTGGSATVEKFKNMGLNEDEAKAAAEFMTGKAEV